MTPYHTPARLVILAPNWLGDAVMALPAIADVRRALPAATIAVAARPSVAPLFAMVRDVDDVVALSRRALDDGSRELRGGGYDTALLLPNSLKSAFTVLRAGIRERWGYRADGRTPILTRGVHRPSGLHQVEYYQQLVHALGFPNGPNEPRVDVPRDARETAATLLEKAGWNRTTRLVALAPGAAYGGAKRWPPERFAALAAALASDEVQSVIVGSAADRRTADEVRRAFEVERTNERGPASIDLVGRTSLGELAGVLTACRTLVTNDSGAMHLAAAVGVPVTAVFGPTDERATRPLGDGHAVITGPAWCRPCMLRECPLEHSCMRGIDAHRVTSAARRTL